VKFNPASPRMQQLVQA